MANVIREDIIKVDYDVDDGGLRDAIKMLDNFRKSLSNGIDMSGIESINKCAEPAKEALKDLESGIKSAEESAGFFYDSMKKACAAAYDLDLSGIAGDIEIFDARVAVLKDNFNALKETVKSIVSHPIQTLGKSVSSVKNEISETIGSIKKLAQVKLSNLTNNVREVYSTLSRGQTGAKGFVTALKSIGKVGLEKTISGFENIKRSVKNISFDKIKSGLSGIKSGAASVLTGFNKFSSGAQKAASKIKSAFSSVGSKIKSVASDISSAADSITSKLFNIKSLIAGVATGAVVQNSIGIVVDRQNITSQFEVLLGSAEKANERVNELTDFAGTTPFTRDEIFAASKQLQVFTGDALSTGDSLRVIGDVASGTGQSFEEVALWTGRLYDAMKSGNAVGEMTARLQEMGAISGEDRTKIENLAEAGGDITQNWEEVEKIFSRYDGTMEKLSNNLGNMLTSLKSFAANSIFLPLGEGIASGLQPAIQKFRDFRKTHKENVDAMGEVIHNFAENICIPLFSKIEQGVEFAVTAIGSLKDGLSGLNNLKGKSPLLDKLIEAVNFVAAHKDSFMTAAKGIAAAIGGIAAAGKFTKIISGLKMLFNPLTLVTAAFGLLFKALKTDSENGGTALTSLKDTALKVFEAVKEAFSAFAEIISNNKDVFTDVINTIVELLPPLAEAFGEVLTSGLELATAALPVLLDVFGELFEAVKPLLEQLPDFIKFIGKIIKACAKADVIEVLVKGFIAYKTVMPVVNAVTKIHSGLLGLQAVKAKIAAAAMKLFNLAMNANPIMLVVSAIGLLVGGFVLLSKKFSKGKDDTDALGQHIDEVTGSIHSMRDAFDNAKVTLPDYDKLISYKGNTISGIDEMIAEKEQAITDILTEAIKEQKGLRDEDIKNIKQYTQDLSGLENEKLSIYADQQTTQVEMLTSRLQYGNPDQQEIANILATGTEAHNSGVDAINDVFNERGTTLLNQYKAECTLIENNEELNGIAKSEALKQANARYQNELYKLNRDNKARLEETDASYSTLYNSAITKSGELVAKSGFDFDVLKSKLDGYDSYLDNINNKTSTTYTTIAFDTDKFTGEINTMILGMSDDTKQQLHNMFITLNEAKNQGVSLSNESKERVDTILRMFESMPPETQEMGREILAGLLQGITDENGNAIDTTDMTCQEIVEAARSAFDVHSPSRVFAEIGENIGLGLLQGIKSVMPAVIAGVTTSMLGLAESASGFNLDGINQNADNMLEGVVSSFTQMEISVGAIIFSIKGIVISTMKVITSTVVIYFKNMKSQTVIIVQAMSANVVSAMNQMKSNIDSLDLYSSGINIMNGLINGMESKRTVLSATAQSIAQTVKNTMNSALDIHSPSKELYKTGVYTGLGQINGMKSTLPEIQQTADKMGETSIPENNSYAPSANSTTYSRSTSTENHTYAPAFNLTISGTSDDRSMARKVKKWIAESLEETFSSYESKNSPVREV